jgi:hypothetical protein
MAQVNQPAPLPPQPTPPLPAILPSSLPERPAAPAAPEKAGPGDQGRLTLRRAGALTSDTFAFAGRVVVGRFDVDSGPVDVDLSPLPESSYLSRRHAEFWRDDSGAWFMKDLGSQNGTFFRPAATDQFQRVTQPQAIADGDEVAFGNARFEFRSS